MRDFALNSSTDATAPKVVITNEDTEPVSVESAVTRIKIGRVEGYLDEQTGALSMRPTTSSGRGAHTESLKEGFTLKMEIRGSLTKAARQAAAISAIRAYDALIKAVAGAF